MGYMVTHTQEDFNPRSPHGERPRGRVRALPHFRISIHAPRTGSDYFTASHCPLCNYFNPRSPHGERRNQKNQNITPSGFQSTLPARGATYLLHSMERFGNYFNPRSPHGERHKSS